MLGPLAEWERKSPGDYKKIMKVLSIIGQVDRIRDETKVKMSSKTERRPTAALPAKTPLPDDIASLFEKTRQATPAELARLQKAAALLRADPAGSSWRTSSAPWRRPGSTATPLPPNSGNPVNTSAKSSMRKNPQTSPSMRSPTTWPCTPIYVNNASPLQQQGVAYSSPGQRPGDALGLHRALRGRHRRCIAPSGLGSFWNRKPRAMPWASISCPVGAEERGTVTGAVTTHLEGMEYGN